MSELGGPSVAGVPPPRLALSHITKSFGGIRALRDVSFDIKAGEIHALLGENGAGKSTLVKIVSGLYTPDAGEMRLDGEPCRFLSPMEARRAGVIAVYQDPKLFPHLDVAENIFMGVHPLTGLGTIDRRRMYETARALLADLDAQLEPTMLVAGLSIGEIQFVEFARAMAEGNARLIFLDEPTAALTPAETARLFRIVRRLRERGTAIVFISHRLEELEGLVDTVTVLRDGEHVASRPAAELDEAAVMRLMVGRSVEQLYPRDGRPVPAAPGRERLRVDNLGQRGVFEGISFSLHAGEIVAMAGLVGAGRSEIAHTLFGVTPPTAGRVFLDAAEVRVSNPRQMLELGLAYLPEDRDGEGLIPALSIVRNLVLPIMGRLSRLGLVRPAREWEIGAKFASDLQIKAASLEQAVATFRAATVRRSSSASGSP
ncbi:MAG: sugar ABC transporter ATP-binding protein [Methylobacteriaceae bacterium]|nr:sugar ABC transporter ATP-binding protein [Methylobacteriaceae bacterium]